MTGFIVHGPWGLGNGKGYEHRCRQDVWQVCGSLHTLRHVLVFSIIFFELHIQHNFEKLKIILANIAFLEI